MNIHKCGLVLEGGAMRGLFTAGIMDVLMENNIVFDGIIGVSAGAAFGCNYKSRQIGRVLRYNTRYCRDWRYCSLRSWWKSGDLFGADFCYRELPEKLDIFDRETFEHDPAEFFVVCTDVHTGRSHYQKCDHVDEDCFRWMRASASMPLVSRVVGVAGGEYMDGAISDSIPLRFFEARGYERCVVILTQPAGYRKTPPRAMWLLKWALRKYPVLAEALAHRHEKYNETLEYIENAAREGRIFLFRPERKLPVDRICHDPELLRRTWAQGKELAEKELSGVREFLGQ